MSQLSNAKRAVALLAVFSMAMVGFTAPSGADLNEDIDKANNAAPAANPAEMSEVDVANVDLSVITEQLKVLNKQVTLSASKKKKLEAERKFLDGQSTDFESEITDIQTEIDQLEVELSGRAIDSFMKQSDDSVLIIDSDPSDSIRKRKLSSSAAKDEVETAEELRQKRADLAAKEVAKDDIKKKLDDEAEENKKSLAKYESARTALVDLAEEAEDRAGRTLFEAESLEENNDKAAADELRKSVEDLGEQIRIALKDQVKKIQAEIAANPEKFVAKTVEGDVSPGDIAEAGNGIRVHKGIVAQVKAMLAAAEAQGITLAGGGYRSNASQIAIRKNNCGTSSYAVYQMPSSSCRPPTARPGSSQHEKGLAIDFTANGSTLRRGSPGYIWLTNNAAAYGLKNFPRESWHWSTTGK